MAAGETAASHPVGGGGAIHVAVVNEEAVAGELRAVVVHGSGHRRLAATH